MKNKDILKIKFYCDDLNKEITIREYFQELLITLWEEIDGFSGKRPFGNSSWTYVFVKPLIENNILKGNFDKYGYVENYDYEKYHSLVLELINEL